MNEKEFAPEINELINEPDNIEKIRDRLACIIKGETKNQKKLAAASPSVSADDFTFKVFIENARPYDISDEDEPPIEYLINVMLRNAAAMEGNARFGNQKEKATFEIDCIAFGNDGGEQWNDKVAASRGWKAARVIRRILMSEQYTYLGLRGIIGSRNIVKLEGGVPENGGDAFSAYVVRITLEIQFSECAINTQGQIIEGIDFTIDPSSGEVLINDKQ